MQPTTLSASSVSCFELCEARYKATYIDRGREMGGAAANLGTTVHEACEHGVVNWMVHTPGESSVPKPEFTLANLQAHFRQCAQSNGLDAEQVKQGCSMLKVWFDWHEENGWNEVLCAEIKETFELKHPVHGSVPFTFIWDRGDRLPNGAIEVVDYKSFGQPMATDVMATKVQVRAYGLSAMMKYKGVYEIPHVWVTYWLLRFGPISVRFDRADNLETYKYLQDVFDRIVKSTGDIETINTECKWCVRKASCETLKRHQDVGGILAYKPEQQARLLIETRDRLSALRNLAEELESQLNDHLEENESIEEVFDGVKVFLKPTKRRDIDGERAAKVIGPELAAKWGTIGVTVVDQMMKNEPELTDDMKLQLKRLIKQNTGAKLEVQAFSAFDDSGD